MAMTIFSHFVGQKIAFFTIYAVFLHKEVGV